MCTAEVKHSLEDLWQRRAKPGVWGGWPATAVLRPLQKALGTTLDSFAPLSPLKDCVMSQRCGTVRVASSKGIPAGHPQT